MKYMAHVKMVKTVQLMIQKIRYVRLLKNQFKTNCNNNKCENCNVDDECPKEFPACFTKKGRKVCKICSDTNSKKCTINQPVCFINSYKEPSCEVCGDDTDCIDKKYGDGEIE